MNTKQMEYILELARTKNFNRAAENLYISQPALTYQIKTVEEEIGFNIFERSGKGVYVTPAGQQFNITLRNILDELGHAIEQGINHQNQFTKTVSIGMPIKCNISYLAEAIQELKVREPSISITAKFKPPTMGRPATKTDADINFLLHENVVRLSDLKEYHLYDSSVYCVVPTDDPLADKTLIKPNDLLDRTITVFSGKYPAIMKYIYQQVMSIHPEHVVLNSDIQMALLTVESHSAIALLPGFFNNHEPNYKWIPCDIKEKIQCSLVTSKTENRESVLMVVRLLQEIYKKHENEPL